MRQKRFLRPDYPVFSEYYLYKTSRCYCGQTRQTTESDYSSQLMSESDSEDNEWNLWCMTRLSRSRDPKSCFQTGAISLLLILYECRLSFAFSLGLISFSRRGRLPMAFDVICIVSLLIFDKTVANNRLKDKTATTQYELLRNHKDREMAFGWVYFFDLRMISCDLNICGFFFALF